MNTPLTPQEVVTAMLVHDKFTAWMGLEIDEIKTGYCKLHYKVKNEMLNGFARVHGGILFAASDSAFAFACNSHGWVTVALDVSITFTRAVTEGETLTVEASELYAGKKTGLYDVKTFNENGELICAYKGTAYRTSKQFEK
jgi:acyl-CoA thioesterase